MLCYFEFLVTRPWNESSVIRALRENKVVVIVTLLWSDVLGFNGNIVNRGEWLWSPANIKGANKHAKIYVGRFTTVHNRLFCARRLCVNYITSTFLLESSSVRSKQLLCFVHGQGKKKRTKHTTKNFVGFNNHSLLLTMVERFAWMEGVLIESFVWLAFILSHELFLVGPNVDPIVWVTFSREYLEYTVCNTTVAFNPFP